VPVDSPEGQEAIAAGGFTWEGAGPEGMVIIDKFDKEMPFLGTCAKIAKKRAEENGFVKLLSGRRCHFEKGNDGKYQWTHKAFNRIIQGTSAEQTKRIMLAVANEPDLEPHMILQVHDELDFSFPSIEQGDRCAEVMRNAVPMLVPTVVDIERGPSWGESMGVEYKDAAGAKQKVTYRWGMKIVDGVPTFPGGIL
jgi:DNA polymerase I-like protein with 3'-5' exonuclease and polymerase domains